MYLAIIFDYVGRNGPDNRGSTVMADESDGSELSRSRSFASVFLRDSRTVIFDFKQYIR